ncbi:hypothetical protein [Phytobacter ursingii]|jgi:hypothetical protein|uniref:Uncharacterized protein n=1 Tax=Phytobacter ursingii TaxID=1972431 RepID=A0AB35RUE0_9ENTR|nr:hypothetical protein [Phytobacter ursingii]MDV2865625.1 hypothetical protein [Phytobacter ursingii]
MKKLKKVLFKTKEEAEAQTGYFSVSSLMITHDLARKIYSYISSNGLTTFSQPNQKKTCNNTYTLNFTLKIYHNTDKPKAYISLPGAIGYYKHTLETRVSRINPGSPTEQIITHYPSDDNLRKFEELKARSPTLEQIYFWIVQKYPHDLLWMDYSMNELSFGGWGKSSESGDND